MSLFPTKKILSVAMATLLTISGLAAAAPANAAPTTPTVAFSSSTIAPGESVNLDVLLNGYTPTPWVGYYLGTTLLNCQNIDDHETLPYDALTSAFPGQTQFRVGVYDSEANASCPDVFNPVAALAFDTLSISLPDPAPKNASFGDAPAGTALAWDATMNRGADWNYTLDAGSLPDGLSLDATTGQITGTPTTPGAYDFTIAEMSDSVGYMGTHQYTGTITTAPTQNVLYATPTTGRSNDTILLTSAPDTFLLPGATTATFTSTGFALTVDVNVDQTFHSATITVPQLPLAQTYDVSVDSTGTPIGSFTYTYLGDGAPATPPTLTLNTDTLAENQSLTQTITGDLTEYGECVFVDTVLNSCSPVGQSGPATFTWADATMLFGPSQVTFRLLAAADINGPLPTWDTPYVSSASVQILPAAPAALAPDAVVTLTATPVTYNAVRLDWTAPNDGGSPITGYDIYRDGILIWTAAGTDTSAQFDGMTALSDHTFVIVAVNAIGASTGFSANVTTVDATFTVDDTLPHGTVAIIYNQSLTINWNGFYGNQISTVTASGLPDGLTLDTVISEGLSFTVTGTPTTPGTYPVTITMTLTDGLQLTQQITIVVDEATVTPGAPSISVSSHDLAENGSVAWTLTGDATGYAICGFVNDIISGCIQANGFPATGSWVWSQLHPAYGNATFTLRLYLVSDITDPTALTIDTPYVSSDWFQIAPATPTAPAQVSDLTVVSTTTSSADLTWTPAVGAGQYTIYVNGTLVATVDGATASYTATGLTADTEYTFSIVASNENGDSAQADTTATTQADNTTTGGGGNGGGSNGSAPGAVTDLTHALVTTTTAHLNWTAVDGATSYKVYVNGTLVASVDGATTTYDLEALTAGTDYIISVEASNTYGDSAQADDTFTTTKTPVVIHVNGKTIKIGFSADSAKLSAATKKALKALVAFAHAKGLTTISVVGYTKKYDSKHETWRANLGKKRATAIATYLKTLDKNLNLTALGKGSVNKGRVAVVTIKGADITN